MMAAARCRLLLRSYWSIGVAIFALVAVSGCAGEKYSANRIPDWLAAAPRDNPQTIDLSRLAKTSPPSDIIDYGDVVEVTIAAGLDEKEKVTIPVRVNEEGQGVLPLIGPIQLAGLDPITAEAAISETCIQRDLYRSPHVTVTMKRQRTNRVMVVGAVEKPGIYQLPRNASDLLAALTAAGSLSKEAGSTVEIRNPRRKGGIAAGGDRIASKDNGDIERASGNRMSRGEADANGVIQTEDDEDSETIHVNLVSAARKGNGGYLVADGAVVNVEKRDPEPLHVLGLVYKPDRYEFPIAEDVRVLDAIALAGGVNNPVADKVYIIRKVPGKKDTKLIEASISKAKRDKADNPILAPGDIVSVEQTPSTVLVMILLRLNLSVGGAIPLIP
jgi:polysaccharide biosynthesis/export protein